jgi:DNA adenine methylase
MRLMPFLKMCNSGNQESIKRGNIMTTEMKVKAIAPWFGSKRNLAPDIIAELGPHRAYWEPFCGSISVLLAKPRSSMETVNDLNGDLVNLARRIQDPKTGLDLYRRLRRTWMCSDLFRDSAVIIKEHPFQATPERAFHYFVFCWMGRNGDSGTTKVGYHFCRRFTKNGGHAATRFKNVVDSIPAFNDRMRNITILNDDGFGLLERIEDADGVVLYLDPPYIEKGAKYVHDFNQDDHARLSELLQRFKKTRVVVSYYEHPLLDSLYPGWTKRRLKATKAMVNQGRRDKGGAVAAPEVLLINGPSLVESSGQGNLF